jgi:hypothetical protein
VRRIGVLAAVVALVAVMAPAAVAKPDAVRLDAAGTYDDPGVTTVSFRTNQRKARVRTVGLSGFGTVNCTNTACQDLGLDGTEVAVSRDLDLILSFKGSDEELQAIVRGRSRGSFIFTDGFESGDLARVRGAATCNQNPEFVPDVCGVTLQLRSRIDTHSGPARAEITLTGELSFGTEGSASWGIVDWLLEQ